MVRDDGNIFEQVRLIVSRIPAGKVTTYGHIAACIGGPQYARLVGWALHRAGDWHLPAHRVVNRDGFLTGKRHFASPIHMEERLRSEGIHVSGDGRVDLKKYLWIPEFEADVSTGGPIQR